MSLESLHPDELRWNEKYRHGSHHEPERPPQLLLNVLPSLSRGRALDLACGQGRNALWLARAGFDVQAVDISRVALEQLQARAQAQGLLVKTHHLNLEQWEAQPLWGEGPPAWELITCTRYLERSLFERLPRLLAPGGYVLYEALLSRERPSPSAFRLHPEELWAAFEQPGLRRVGREESEDGQALAVLVQRTP